MLEAEQVPQAVAVPGNREEQAGVPGREQGREVALEAGAGEGERLGQFGRETRHRIRIIPGGMPDEERCGGHVIPGRISRGGSPR